MGSKLETAKADSKKTVDEAESKKAAAASKKASAEAAAKTVEASTKAEADKVGKEAAASAAAQAKAEVSAKVNAELETVVSFSDQVKAIAAQMSTLEERMIEMIEKQIHKPRLQSRRRSQHNEHPKNSLTV